jgi:hypothetical protein
MKAVKGKTVDGYVAGLDDWQQEIVEAVRKLLREGAPKATESIKWGQPVYEDNGPFAYIKAYSKQVNFGFWRGADLKDPMAILQGDGNRMRHVKLAAKSGIEKGPLLAFIRAAVKLNRAKGDPTKRK